MQYVVQNVNVNVFGLFRHDSFADDLADTYFDHLWNQRAKVTKSRSKLVKLSAVDAEADTIFPINSIVFFLHFSRCHNAKRMSEYL